MNKYVITVYFEGKDIFAIELESLDKVRNVGSLIKEKFPEGEGYFVTLGKFETYHCDMDLSEHI